MSRTSSESKSTRRVRVLAAAVLTGLVVAGTPAAAATSLDRTTNVVRQSPDEGLSAELAEIRDELKRNHRPDAVQKSLDELVAKDTFPAALAAVQDRKGRTRHYTAGVADLTTKAKVPVDGQVRVASNTKMFTSVTVLQLVGEGKVSLDEPIETYLPKVVRGKGIDGGKITVRQLLQHTSGLPEYVRYLPGVFSARNASYSPQDLLKLAFAREASFAPGTSWEYSNTNYVLAGLLIEKVTGRPLAEAITDRIIKPIGLRHTYWPAKGDATIRGRHPQGYGSEKPGGKLVDITDQDPSRAWAAGQLIATPSDLNRFMSALVDGKLLKPAQLAAMKHTVKATGMPAGWEYGLGLVKMPLTCGGVAWGHGGDIDGYETRNGVTEGGRAATVAVTALPATRDTMQHVIDAMDTALCSKR
ncbi:serine hydrolase [Nonomuraea sp. NEAU-A123]|uniref:serine hydrolase domain-containing protein n=1 Tax=Nonomuraea sp. NEAU-A123 TaxID=2839649 RepID=UPI001BE45F61|nr:serine hydrolase domain-containing protein [Nonomuraea sp. NEAU-A123]MBT2232270.1 beta-lactamase family protein [Nonomuraea sp. NEAU-A123]